MAAENIRGDTPKQSPPVVENEQFSDIILILDKMELLLQAVTKLDKNGRYESVPAKEENRNSFLKLDRYANMFESFVKNLWSQLKDPTRFGILSVKEQALDDPKVRQAIEDLAAGKKTDAVEEFLAKYDITPKGDDWIIWLPTTKGFFSPRNVKKVHAYGIEVKANLAVQPAKDWLIDLNGSYSWTPSINEGEKMSPADQSVGKQLPYVPEHSASLTGRLSWRSWAFLYKWTFYSERFTMSSNDYTLTGHLPEYFMSNVSLEKNLFFKPVDVQLKFAVNNLFNEDYLSVLSRPMPGINFELFIGITPKFGKNKKKSVNTNL